MNEVIWTTEKPTKVGWYWATWTECGAKFIVWVGRKSLKDSDLCARFDGEVFQLSDFHVFQGPLAPK